MRYGLRLRHNRCWEGLLAVCAAAGVAGVLLVGPQVLLHPGRSAVGFNPASDFQIMTWSLRWWPWALGRGLDPFHTALLWRPSGFSTLWITSIPFPALLGLPMTLGAGPLVAYNLLMLAAPVLAAGGAYLLCFELSGRIAPSLLGGLAFGFSPYMLGHTLSQHLNLTFVFPLPLLALVGVRHLRGKTGGRCAAVLAVALLLMLAGSSLELYVDCVALLALSLPLALLLARASRPLVRRLIRLAGWSVAGSLLLLLPVAVLALVQPHSQTQNPPDLYAVDLLNLLVPTPTLLLGLAHPAEALSAHFVGNIGERDGYLGVPLVVVGVLALRAHWRRGAWLAALLTCVALLLSLGPTPAADGRPLVALPFSTATLPLLRDALPARLSVFAMLGVISLFALWFSRPRARAIEVSVAVLTVCSLLPNPWPSRAAAAWAGSDRFGWATARVARGFVEAPRWSHLLKPGSNILVLPTRDRTAASYWQAESGFRFGLAMAGTPFLPPDLAADPTAVRLADDVLPQLDGLRLGAARLRAFIRADQITGVIATPEASGAWRVLVRRATATRPINLGRSLLFLVRRRLPPLQATGEAVTAPARGPWRPARDRPRLRAWVRFDGSRGHVEVRLSRDGRTWTRPAILSSPVADAEAPQVAINRHGDAAVVFAQWRRHLLALAVARTTGARWRVSILDRNTLPIWSARVAVLDDGTTIATWIDEDGLGRTLHVAVKRPGHRWWQSVLDRGDGLATEALTAGQGQLATIAWHDTRANEQRLRAAVYRKGAWLPTKTIVGTLAFIGWVTVPSARVVRWVSFDDRRPIVWYALRHGRSWTPPLVRRRLPGPRPDLTASHSARLGGGGGVSAARRVRRLSPGTGGGFMVAGRRMFLIGLSNPPPLAGRTPAGLPGPVEVVRAGVNVVRAGPAWTGWSRRELEHVLAWEHAAVLLRVHVWVRLNAFAATQPRWRGDARLAAVVHALTRNRFAAGIGLWQGADEPWSRGIPARSLAFFYCRLTSRGAPGACRGEPPLDRHHLLVTMLAPTGTPAQLAPYGGETDSLGVDVYPVTLATADSPDLHQVGVWTRTIARLSRDHTVETTLQICPARAYDRYSGAYVLPSAYQERYMVYDAIINGAGGVSFFGGGNPHCWNRLDRRYGWNWTFWNRVLDPLIEQIGSGSPLGAALGAAASNDVMETTDPGTEAISRIAVTPSGRQLWVIAARHDPGTKHVSITISGVPASVRTAAVYGERRTVHVSDGTLTDSFRQWQVHVYRIQLPAPHQPNELWTALRKHAPTRRPATTG